MRMADQESAVRRKVPNPKRYHRCTDECFDDYFEHYFECISADQQTCNCAEQAITDDDPIPDIKIHSNIVVFKEGYWFCDYDCYRNWLMNQVD